MFLYLSLFFSLKFHDLANVVDFIILKQWYEKSLDKEWSVGDKFRSIIDNQWYNGTIIGRENTGHGSHFRIYQAIWDEDPEEDKLSPWDIEGIPKRQQNSNSNNDMIEFACYEPKEVEWPPHGDRETVCQRIISCLDQVMSLSSAEPFLVPVDYTAYPTYLCMVAYPIDLSLIRERLGSNYYRRCDAIKWDINLIAENAETFNEAGSIIVKHAKHIVNTMEAIIDDPDCVDANSILLPRQSARKRNRVTYNEDLDSSDLDSDDHGYEQTSTAKRARNRSSGSASSLMPQQPPNWSTLCHEILSRLWKSPASAPFHTAVDPNEYPDYYRLIENPIDLGSIRRRLRSGVYQSATAFVDDIRQLFDNSRLYNTNDRSQIYMMTTKLIDIFDGALSEFGELLELDHDNDNDNQSETTDRNNGLFSSAASASSSNTTTKSVRRPSRSVRGTSSERNLADQVAGFNSRPRTRLRTGTIYERNFNEVCDNFM